VRIGYLVICAGCSLEQNRDEFLTRYLPTGWPPKALVRQHKLERLWKAISCFLGDLPMEQR